MITSATIILVLIIVFYFNWKASNLIWIKPKYSYRAIGSELMAKEDVIIQKDGTKIRTKSIGKGQPVILAHDYGISLLEWNILAKELVHAGFKVIMFDQRGHCKSTIGKGGISSQSMATAYRDVLNHYDVKNGILVGHGMGGFLSIVFMLTYPELVSSRLKSSVLISSFGGELKYQSAWERFCNHLVKTGLYHHLTKIQVFGYPFGKYFIGNEMDKNIIKAYLKAFNYNRHKKLSPILKALQKESYYNNLHRIDIPCSIVMGTHNKTIPSYHSRKLANAISNSELVYIEGKGHLLNWEAPKSLAQEITSISKNKSTQYSRNYGT